MDTFINPPDVPRGAAARRWSASSEQAKKFPEQPGARRAAVPARARAARALGARRPRDRPRRGLLLRAAGADQDHERGLGLVLALQDHDREGARRLGDHRLRRPQRGRAGHRARAAQPVQARRRAVPRHRGPLEQGAVRQGVGRVRRPRRATQRWDKRLGLGPREDLRGAQALQRRHLHRRVPHAGVLPRAQALHASATTSAPSSYEIESREFKKIKEKLLFTADQLRPARSSASRTATTRTAASCSSRHKHDGVDLQDRPRARHAAAPPADVAPPGEPASPASRAAA